MLLDQQLALEAALTKIFYVRDIVQPNEGFWRQLRDLEARLLERGMPLRGLRPGELKALEKVNPDCKIPWQRAVVELIATLDKEAGTAGYRGQEPSPSLASVHVTGHVFTTAGQAAAAQQLLLDASPPPGMAFDTVVLEGPAVLGIRVSLAATRVETAPDDVRTALLALLGGSMVARIEVERCGPPARFAAAVTVL